MVVSTPPMSSQVRMRAVPPPTPSPDASRRRDKVHEVARTETPRDRDGDRDGDGDGKGRELELSPASTEVISSLITSLSVIPRRRPTGQQADRPSHVDAGAPVASDPLDEWRFFGVDYGASKKQDRPLATSRSARSGSPSSTTRDAGQARALTGRNVVASRTSSMVSACESIGNPSIEPGPVSQGHPEAVRRQRSFDSWGKKSGRRPSAHKSSRERMRGREADRPKASDGLATGGPNEGLVTSSSVTACTDVALAEGFIGSEEITEGGRLETHVAWWPDGNANSLVHIPVRESSLRLAPRRPSDENPKGPSESTRQHGQRQQHQQQQQQQQQQHDLAVNDKSVDLARRGGASASFSRPQPHGYGSKLGTPRRAQRAVSADDIDECAPAPSVSQRRSSGQLNDSRRRSSRPTQDMAHHSPHERRPPPGGAVAAADDGADHPPHVAYERSGSADSIDDEVEKYLGSPRLSQTIQDSATGRAISFSEVGDPSGSAVFCCVGMGLTRYITAFYDELALTLKLRLITPDRPGVGDSEPYAEGTATPLGWPDDVYAICQHLRITKFSIIAHSAGAIYALATALRMPQHIRGKMHLLAPWIPPSQMTVLGASAQTPLPPQKAMPTSQRILRALPTPILKAANSSFMSATSSSITSSLPRQKKVRRDRFSSAALWTASARKGPDDKENDAGAGELPPLKMPLDLSFAETMDHMRPEATRKASSSGGVPDDDPSTLSAEDSRERQQTYDERLTRAIWQLATTGANPAVDLLVCLERRHPIGFRYVDITRPVVIHHGARDTRVPVDNVRWLGNTMRRCEVRVLDGEGHGLMASAPVMGAVLMEVSREWEEWGRVTGATKREKDGERAKKVTLAIGTAR